MTSVLAGSNTSFLKLAGREHVAQRQQVGVISHVGETTDLTSGLKQHWNIVRKYYNVFD